MQREKTKVSQSSNAKTTFDSASLFFSVLAVLLIAIGIYLNTKNQSAVGISQPGRYAQGGGTVLNILGLFVIVLGLFFAAFPILDLIRSFRGRQ
jgi:ABC-type Fe3+ transport system permease subunit